MSFRVRVVVDKTRPVVAMRTNFSVCLLVGVAMVVSKTKEKKAERSMTPWPLGWGLHMCTFDVDGP